MQDDGYGRIDFDRATVSVSQSGRGGRWRVVITYKVQEGENPDGSPILRRRQKNKTLPANVKTKRGAQVKAGEWVAQLKEEQGTAMAVVAERREREEAERRAEEEARERAAKLTVWQCVDDYITGSLAGNYIEASTAMDYRFCERRIHSTLPDMPLDELTPEVTIAWQERLETTHAHTTVKKTRSLLRRSVQEAIDRGRTELLRNPVVTIRQSLNDKHKDKDNAPKLNALDKDGRSTLLAELDRMADTPVTIAARIALYAGLREAEICALQWKDVFYDEKNAIWFIRVDKAMGKRETDTNQSAVYVKPQKSGGGKRDVPIHPELLEALKRWRVHQQAITDSLEVPLKETWLIGNPAIKPPKECFDYLNGTDRTARTPEEMNKLVGNASAKPEGSYSPALLSREWRALARSSRARGMLGKPVSFHNLRHTFGFYCAGEGGIKIEQLADWMGHESITTTKKYYVARDEELARSKSAEAMEKLSGSSVVREKRGDVVQLKTGTDA